MVESWKAGSDTSKTKGTKYHKYLENAWNNKYETHDRIEVLDNIIKVLSSQYIPIKLEWVVADLVPRAELQRAIPAPDGWQRRSEA